jgi:hypothetical protein
MTRFGIGKCFVAAIAAGLCSAPTFAVMTVKVHDGPGNGPGGEFKVEPLSGFSFSPAALTNGGYFESFCLEKNEYLNFGQTYVVGVSQNAMGGGVGGQTLPGIDPISNQTQYLYWKFINGTLNDYDYTMGSGRVASADALQNVIWVLENEQAQTWTNGDNSLEDKFYQDALANAGSGIGAVRVLNMYELSDGQRKAAQDLLVAVVPVPASALLVTFGLGLAGAIRRRLA